MPTNSKSWRLEGNAASESSGGLDDVCEAVRRQDFRKLSALVEGGAPVNEPKECGCHWEKCPFLIAVESFVSPREIGGILEGYKPEKHDYWKQDSFQSGARINKKILDLLVINGATVFPLQNVSFETSIHAAAKADNSNAVEIILGLHPEADNYNALEVSAERGCFQSTKALLASSGRVSFIRPFELALESGFCRTAKELIDYVPEGFPLLDQHSKALFEMLRWSAIDDHTKSFQALVKYLEPIKHMPSYTDRARWDLWHEKERVLKKCFGDACRFASVEMVRLAFSAVEVMDINKDGNEFGTRVPPLVFAANKGKFELVEFCLRVGADPFVHGDDGMTALDVAKQNGFTKLVVLLEQAMKGNYAGKAKSLFRKFIR